MMSFPDSGGAQRAQDIVPLQFGMTKYIWFLKHKSIYSVKNVSKLLNLYGNKNHRGLSKTGL